MSDKFSGITYPIFVLKEKPIEILYSKNKISIRRNYASHLETVDDKSISGDYFNRLLQLKTRVIFDFTCKNLQDLIISDVKWGIDSKAIPHDLSSKKEYEIKKVKVVRIINNYMWVEKISYPFKIDTKEDITSIINLYVVLIKINTDWLVKEFTYDSTPIKERMLL
jgi:hypothetical protein